MTTAAPRTDLLRRTASARTSAHAPTGATVVDLTVAGLMVGAASLAFLGSYGRAELARTLPLVMVLPVLAVGLTGRTRADGTRSSAAVGAVVGMLAVILGTLGAVVVNGGSIAEAVSGFTSVWADLLTRTLPVDGEPALLVVPALATGIAALITALLVVHRRGPLAPLVPPLALILLARLLGGSIGAPPWAVLVVGVTATTLVARRAGPAGPAGPAGEPSASTTMPAATTGGTPTGRTMAAVVPLAAAVTLVGVVVGYRLPFGADRPARTLRDTRTLSLEDLSRSNPLTDVRASTASAAVADEVVATVRITGPTPLGNALTLVSLDAFDGAGWRSSAQYRRAGRTLPDAAASVGAAATPSAPTTAVRQEITVRAESAPWLPTVPRATRVESSSPSVDWAVDPVTGAVAVTTATLAPGSTFTIESAAVRPDPAALPRAAIPADPALAGLARLPAGTPPEVASAATEAMGTARSPFQQASALEAWFRTGGRFTVAPDGAGGISFGLLARFVADTPNARRGTEEQFAAAFAVLARSRGLPTRLTIGYRLPAATEPSTTGPDSARSYDLRRRDLAVWPEVAFAGIGWIPFDPMPSADAGAAVAPPPDEPVEAAKQQAAQLANDPQAGPPPAATNPVLQAAANEAGSGGRTAVFVVAVGLAVLAAAAALVAIGRPLRARRRRARRRAQRRAAGPARVRTLSAWHEVVDHIDELDVAPALGSRGSGSRGSGSRGLGSSTVPEVTAMVEATWGPAAAAPARALGQLVSTATFGPDGATDADADEAWRHADLLLPLLDAPR